MKYPGRLCRDMWNKTRNAAIHVHGVNSSIRIACEGNEEGPLSNSNKQKAKGEFTNEQI